MQSISKDLLIARLNYLIEMNSKPGLSPVNPKVNEKVKELIDKGDISNYMALESVYNYLEEKFREDETQMDQYAQEIISFIS